MTQKVLYPRLEALQLAADRKRRIAEQLAKASQQEERIVSPFQVLGKWAQAFSADRQGRKADELQGQYNTQVKESRQADIAKVLAGLQSPNSTIADRAALIAQYADVLPESITKPIIAGMTERETFNARPHPRIENGMVYDDRKLEQGDLVRQDASKLTMYDKQGNIVANPAALQANIAVSAAGAGQVPPGQGITIPSTPNPMGQQPNGSSPQPSEQSLQMLKQGRNNPEILRQFEERYGPGSAQMHLGGQ
jgi:cytochrome c-type biogenesis protein CcmH/NrfF